MKTILFMKIFLLLACVTTLLTANGCLVGEGGGRGHGHREIHGGGVVVVPVPEVRVRPPEVIVR